ncbi:proline dehydrogenase family protein [Priestia endophytica]|jgi:proline dehydrogenase|uniref:proline dehydrogenase n=1 Tax=Priestia endophytica DSM 13796 TaxID=1121089 RepID=A0A1I5Z1P8_9BACI|nr:proline dehydrogenase [Priestia endophytica]KAB2495477.1 proline dehydrogenase [Priestia endophytica]KYG27882.1 proline dehydrogenase [Priestia endophytica]MBG9814097.1 proline dehydrogenase [Priestia endophytica]RAS75877.1 proline dehydrogenase [Priestia endophytica]RAS78064.1 proline dehydrogenase [Priestia endophytica]
MLANVSKNVFLHASQNRVLNKAAKKWGLRFGAGQVVAGDTIEGAMKKVRELNEKGLVCTLDHLGEFVSSREEATEATQYNVRTLEAMAANGVDCNLSVKMTQLGLDIDRSFCLDNMRRILDTAKQYNNFVRIDMEDYAHCQMTLDILRELRETYDNVGTVIQSYLFRAEQDVKDLKGVPLRLVKGAYQESPTVAFQNKEDVDKNYVRIIEEHLLSGSYTAIASHDHNIIEKVKEMVEKYNIPRTQFEFQMLYGFRSELQLSLIQEGYKVRVYVPFGKDWFGYFMRRLAERPQNVAFALKGFFSK